MQDVILELVWTSGRVSKSKKSAYVGWTGMSTPASHTGAGSLEIDPSFAQALGLEPKTTVTVKVHSASSSSGSSSVPIAHTIYLEPQTSSDWEIIELHAQYLEARMLNQVRAVSLKQPIVVFPSPTAISHLTVLKIDPPLPTGSDYNFAKVSVECEVVIAPKVRKKPPPSTSSASKSKSTSGNNRSVAASSTRRKREAAGPCVLLRGVSLPHPTSDFPEAANSSTDYQIFVSPDVLIPLNHPKYAFVSVVRPKSIQKSANGGSGNGSSGHGNSDSTSGVAANGAQASSNTMEGTPADDDSGEIVYPARKVVAKITTCPPGTGIQDHVGLSHALSIALGISETVGNVIRIEAGLRPLVNPPSTLVVRPFVIHSAPSQKGSTTASSLKIGKKMDTLSQSEQLAKHLEDEKSKKLEAIKTLLSNDSGILKGPITSNMRLPPVPDVLPYGAVLQLKSAEGWIAPNAKGKDNTPFEIELGGNLICAESSVGRSLNTILEEIKPVSKSSSKGARRVVGIDSTLAEINDALRSGFSIGGLVYGSRGSGKSAVLQEICNGLYRDCIHHVFVSCGPKAEDPVGSIKELLSRTLLAASWYAPSVVIFDDIDKLIPAEVEHADSTRSRQLAEIFHQLSQSIMSSRPVCIVASTQSKEAIHSHLITSHTFETTVHLKSPDKEVRRAILEEAIQNLGMSTDDSFDMLEISGSTEGYQPGDLWTLVERSKHQTIIRRVQSLTLSSNATTDDKVMVQADFENALDGFVPASLRGVKLQKSSVSWSEIGGLKDTKRILLETLEWPTRYAPIFAKSPLRLRSGLLLYGYPGCGKTLLASAVASQSGLNFISVKGPEILNKYIGASEQSVRDLFERAQAAKPCILFFDEFDSIAPKRGHDSTGVTDRVVNQMLTQMDGAEGLDGVYVLAATSRPDLIDSALLRPGRLDKSMLCDMPNLEDRIDILNAVKIAGNMTLSDSVSLKEIAEETEGYSGADLQAVLYNAYLEAIHKIVDVSDDIAEGDEEKEEEEEEFEFFQVDASGAMTTKNDIAIARAKIAEKQRVKKKMEAFNANSTQSSSADKEEKKSDGEKQGGAQVIIGPSDVQKSLQDTQPSISHNERRKYQRIYEQFVSGRSGDMPNGENSTEIGGRATLM